MAALGETYRREFEALCGVLGKRRDETVSALVTMHATAAALQQSRTAGAQTEDKALHDAELRNAAVLEGELVDAVAACVSGVAACEEALCGMLLVVGNMKGKLWAEMSARVEGDDADCTLADLITQLELRACAHEDDLQLLDYALDAQRRRCGAEELEAIIVVLQRRPFEVERTPA